jgi:hypothetical protein
LKISKNDKNLLTKANWWVILKQENIRKGENGYAERAKFFKYYRKPIDLSNFRPKT